MNQELILYPLGALILLSGFPLLRSAVLNINAAKSKKFGLRVFQEMDSTKLPKKNAWAMNNFSNLYEMPVLLFVLATLLYVDKRVDSLYLVGAWVYVATRAIHTWIHITKNNPLHRLRIFFISCLVLWGLWIRYFYQLWST